jgi:hypothetical protein
MKKENKNLKREIKSEISRLQKAEGKLGQKKKNQTLVVGVKSARNQKPGVAVINNGVVGPSRTVKKSPNGSFFNDGFDVVNQIVSSKGRREAFDEVCFEKITASEGFQLNRVPINPGISSFYPRISKFAKLYEKYKFEKLEFYFVHAVSQYATDGARGLVNMSVLFDAAASEPATRAHQEMCNPHVTCMPNQSALLRVDPKRLHPTGLPLYCRDGPPPGGTDIKTYDAGNLYISTQDMTVVDPTKSIGELRVRGIVHFYDEVIDDSDKLPGRNLFACMLEQEVHGGVAPQSLVTNVEKTVLFDTLVTDNFMGLSSEDNLNWKVPPGTYRIAAKIPYICSGTCTTVQTKIVTNDTTNLVKDLSRSTKSSIIDDTQTVECFIQATNSMEFSIVAFALFSSGTVNLGIVNTELCAKLYVQAI